MQRSRLAAKISFPLQALGIPLGIDSFDKSTGAFEQRGGLEKGSWISEGREERVLLIAERRRR